MRTTVLNNKSNCTGCSACVSVCPKHAITMVPDAEGFLYPRVDPSLCISCNLCEKSCLSGKDCFQNCPEAYAAKNKDEAERVSSSSGGVFTVLAESTLEAGGVVFGAVFDDQMAVEHVGAFTREETDPMRGSKYVQSNAEDGIFHARELIRQGIPVLFSGTPCQIAGLYSSLGMKRPQNLLTVDFVCHGVPSPGVFRSYLDELEKDSHQKIVSYSFRDKRLGWKNFSATAAFEDGTVHTGTQTGDPFLMGFLRNLYLRPSCHVCKLRYGSHAADITLADLWGAGEVCPQMDDDKGLSLVFANTESGRKALNAVKELELTPVEDVRVLSKANPSIFIPAVPHEKRKVFFKLYSRHGFRQKDIQMLIYPGKISRAVRRMKNLPSALLRRISGIRK